MPHYLLLIFPIALQKIHSFGSKFSLNKAVCFLAQDFQYACCQRNYSFLKPQPMLRWTITFLVVALIAALFGFGGIAAGAAGIAKILFFIFLILFVLSLLFGKSFGKTDV